MKKKPQPINPVEEYKKFTKALDTAIELGLELDNKMPANFIKWDAIYNGCTIWAFTYQLVDHNGYKSGHGLFEVFTKIQAQTLKTLIDQSIVSDNKKRKTIIEKMSQPYTIELLNKFIKIRKQEQ